MLRERRRHANFKPNRKLDQKSSRGMIYENEELRLRTININAEVERGQSDIKKLRRENDLLRKEIWSLRDEYDRLDKLLRASRKESRQSNDTVDSDKCDSCNQSDDSQSCDTCNEDDDDDDEQQQQQPTTEITNKKSDKLHVNFDHLSIVSEENLTNSSEELDGETTIMPAAATSGPIPEIKSTANICSALTDFQSTVPPLAHFENLKYEEIGPNLDSSGEVRYNSESTTTTGETVIPCEEWDFSKPSLANPIQSHSYTTMTETNGLTGQQQKHFGPDICLRNALASPQEPIYAEVHKKTTNFQTGGNLDDLLQDIELLSRDILNMQYENQKFHSQFDLNRGLSQDGSHPPLTEGMSKKPPYRSEMNLLLSFDGNMQKITSVPPAASPTLPPPPPPLPPSQDLVQTQETPSPTLPQPMELLPPMLPYTDFQNIQTKQPPPLPPPSPPNDFIQPVSVSAATSESLASTIPDSPKHPSAPVLAQPPIMKTDLDTKRKSRRVSIYFNGKKTDEKLLQKSDRNSDPTGTPTATSNGTGANGPPGTTANVDCNNTKKTHHHRKMSQDSSPSNRGQKKPRRHSDGTAAFLRPDSSLLEPPGISASERTSNSLASSRESSSSLGAQKSRKISIGSHTGGKIPWCGCWGNGCL